MIYEKQKGVPSFECNEFQKKDKEKIIGSVAFVPSVAGLIMAGEVIKDLAR